MIDPDDLFYRQLHSQFDATTNDTGYKNPILDRLAEEGRKTLDKEKRTKIYYKASEIVDQDVPFHNMFHVSSPMGYHPDLKGWFHARNGTWVSFAKGGFTRCWFENPEKHKA